MNLLCEINPATTTFFQSMSLAFNVCLCHDLLRTLKDPFAPGSRRLKFYLILSSLFASVFAFEAYWQSKFSGQCAPEVKN